MWINSQIKDSFKIVATKEEEEKKGKIDVCYYSRFFQNAHPYGCYCWLLQIRPSVVTLDRPLSCSWSCATVSISASSFTGMKALVITKKSLWKPEGEQRTWESQVLNAAAWTLGDKPQTRFLLLGNYASPKGSAVSSTSEIKAYVSVYPDGQGICKRNKKQSAILFFSVQRWRVSLFSPTQSILHHLLSLLATARHR